MLDSYALCPCGSGKKFKWCCQPIHVEIDKAFQQDAEGQHEAAVRIMEKLCVEHPDNPEVWGRKAELLYNLGKGEEAEAALQKSLDINPKYPFGHYLKASFRLHEGEVHGALLLFRQAADLYDPEARSILAQLYTMVFDCEMKLNHPVAGRAALSLALRFDPGLDELRKAIDEVFGPDNPNLPTSAKREYKFLPVAAAAAAERRSAWEKGLASAGSGRLSDAVRAFEKLTENDAGDVAAWYNLALCRAWLGQNAMAVEALDRYVALEADEERAAAAWTLAEVLRCGHGMTDQADYLQYNIDLAVPDPQVLVQAVQKLSQQGSLTGLKLNEDRTVLHGMVVLPPPPALTTELEAKQNPRLGAFFFVMGNLVHMWYTQEGPVEKSLEILRPHLGQQVQMNRSKGPAKFHDILAEALTFPPASLSETEVQSILEGSLAKLLEETWLHRPLKSLSGTPPIDAAGHPGLRKKLRGVIHFVEELTALMRIPYDLNRLRRQLGLLDGAAIVTDGQTPDIGAMSTVELAALAPEALSDSQIEDAFQAALKLDALELAGKFAAVLVARPPRPERPDRYPLFNHLIRMALANGNPSAALEHVNDGERDDCEHNGGKRRNDYELRRAQIQAKAGHVAEAQDIFDRLIGRAPAELKYRGSAAEAMLAAKEPRHALSFAEQGLAEARKQHNRDSEQYFLELANAARKQGA